MQLELLSFTPCSCYDCYSATRRKSILISWLYSLLCLPNNAWIRRRRNMKLPFGLVKKTNYKIRSHYYFNLKLILSFVILSIVHIAFGTNFCYSWKVENKESAKQKLIQDIRKSYRRVHFATINHQVPPFTGLSIDYVLKIQTYNDTTPTCRQDEDIHLPHVTESNPLMTYCCSIESL